MVRTTSGMFCTKGFVSQTENGNKSSSDSHVKTTKMGSGRQWRGGAGGGRTGRRPRLPVVLGGNKQKTCFVSM